MVVFNNNLKFCREELEMTQKELGYVFGVSESTVSGWETGRDSIPLNKLIRFCNLYNYSLDFACGLSRKNTEYNKISTDKKKIGIKLKELRNKLGLAQQQLADDCKISQTTYSGYETGHYLINAINLYIICKKYDVSMDYIVGRTNNIKINK